MSQPEAFKPGDVVQLRSGGPALTVSRDDDVVTCVWFFGNIKAQYDFLATSLKPYSDQNSRQTIEPGKDYSNIRLKSDPDQFKPGDVVELRSGGPALTIRTADTMLYCEWFGDDNKIYGDTFTTAAVKHKTPGSRVLIGGRN